MAEPKRPNSLVFNEALLQGFINGTLESAVEEKIASLLESRPDLLEKISAKSGDGFLKRLREVQQRSAEKPPALVKGEVVEPASVNKPAPKSDSSIPTALANYAGYKIIKELGRGGMGVVYLAKNIQMDRLEVLKVLNERLLDHAGAKERFLREIRAVSKLSHTNIVTSYSILPLDNLLVFAMEYVHGIDLHQYTNKFKPLSIGLACSFAKQIAAGLQHAHEKGLVHRDIKPSNVIVYKSDGQLQLKILDFGLAKATSEEAAKSAGLTQDGTMLGTPEYMSPEQTLNAAQADIRADIYSLGCTLYYMLTRKPPFTGTHGAVLLAHAQRQPTALNLLRPEVPAELAAVVSKMLAKDINTRFQTPIEVADAFLPFINHSKFAGNQSAGAVPNTANESSLPDRETSVDASRSNLSAVDNRLATELEQDLAALDATLRSERTKVKGTPKWLIPAVGSLGMMVLLGSIWLFVSLTSRTTNRNDFVDKAPIDAEVIAGRQKSEVTQNIRNDNEGVNSEPKSSVLDEPSQALAQTMDKPISPLPDANGSDTRNFENSVGMRLALIPAGTFLMGSAPNERGRDADEIQHRVILSRDFYLGTTEVTQEQWRKVMGNSKIPWRGKANVKKGLNYPATYVTWEDAVEFCRKLSEKEGNSYRLPTEAEWEYACRGGTTTAFSFGDDTSQLNEYAWWGAFNGGNTVQEQYPHEVGLKKANAYGLFDMHGNVWEWCSDWVGLYSDQVLTDPRGPSTGIDKVDRGGGWRSDTTLSRSASRSQFSPLNSNSMLGFRVVAEITSGITPAAETKSKTAIGSFDANNLDAYLEYSRPRFVRGSAFNSPQPFQKLNEPFVENGVLAIKSDGGRWGYRFSKLAENQFCTARLRVRNVKNGGVGIILTPPKPERGAGIWIDGSGKVTIQASLFAPESIKKNETPTQYSPTSINLLESWNELVCVRRESKLSIYINKILIDARNFEAGPSGLVDLAFAIHSPAKGTLVEMDSYEIYDDTTLKPNSAENSTPLPEAWENKNLRLANAKGGILDVRVAPDKPNPDVVHSTQTSEKSQLWKIVKRSDGGPYEIENVQHGKVLNVPRADRRSGIGLIVFPDQGGAENELWTFLPNADANTFQIRATSGLVVAAGNDGKVVQVASEKASAEFWKIEVVD